MESPGSSPEDDLRQRMIQKCRAMEQKAQRAKDRLYKVSMSYPNLHVEANKILQLQSVIEVVGSGSFACVFGVPTSNQLLNDNSDDVKIDSERDQDKSNGTQKMPHNATYNNNGMRQPAFSAVLKALQMPIGVQKKLTWTLGGQTKPRFEQQTLRELELTFDELRWMRMFAKELTSLVACRDHPVIVDCHGWCLDDRVLLPTSIMEYAGGATLWHTLFGTSRPRAILGPVPVEMTWQQCLSVYFQMLDCCDFMHYRLPGEPYQYCVHRDISPGNVVVSWPGGYQALPRIKLVDFGLSQLIAPYLNPGEVFLEDGVAVGPDMMFIDPLMWINKHYGRGTDIFNMAHLMLLMLFGMKAVHQTTAVRGTDEYDDAQARFNSVCFNRQVMRDVLRMHPTVALFHRSCPLMPRWRSCPAEILSVLNRQIVLCTTAGPDALIKRPSTRDLIRDWVGVRELLPAELQALLPTGQQFKAQTWEPIGIKYPSPPSPAKPSRSSLTPSSRRSTLQQGTPTDQRTSTKRGVDVAIHNRKDNRSTPSDQSHSKMGYKIEPPGTGHAAGTSTAALQTLTSNTTSTLSQGLRAASYRNVTPTRGPAGAAAAATTAAPGSLRHRDRTPVSYRDPGSGKLLGLLGESKQRANDATRRIDLGKA